MPRQKLTQRKDGRYVCKYQGRSFYGYTAKEALEAREAYKKEAGAGITQPVPLTVSEYASAWLPVHKANVSIRTYNDYARYVNKLILTIGDIPIKEATASDIKSVFSTYFIGLSESAIHKARMLYTAIWDTALDDGYVSKNPCRSGHARPHRGTSGSHRALTKEEDEIILNTPASFRLPVLVMRYAGLRRGEVLALDIDKDVDFDNHVIHVRGAVRYDANQPILSDPKTVAGVRDVPLFDVLERELKGQHGMLAPSAHGKTMSKTAFVSAWRSYLTQVETSLNGQNRRWYGQTRVQKQLLNDGEELPPWIHFKIRPHDLRHSYCTMLRDAGVEMKLAMRWMGHADEKMILRIYDHVTEDREARAIASVNSLFSIEKEAVSSQNGSQIKDEAV